MTHRAIEESYPLTPLQEGMLFQSLNAPQSGVEIWQIVITFFEELDTAALRGAWEEVVARHPALRTSFRWQGLDRPVQDVHRRVRLRFGEQDWRRFSEEEQESRLEAYLRQDRLSGFHLARAPLLRFVLFRTAEREYRLLLTAHHAVVDGRSAPIVFGEMSQFYEGLRDGRELRLGSPPGLRSYVEHIESLGLQRAEGFWRETLRGFKAATALAGARQSRRRGTSADGHKEQQIPLGKTATRALSLIAERQSVSLNTVVQGAWGILLGRYSGDDDVVFGAIKSCRAALPEGRDIVGPMINTVAVRARLSPSMKPVHLLSDLRRHWTALREHEHAPLHKVQEWSETPPGKPLFESLLLFENYQWTAALPALLGEAWRHRTISLRRQPDYPLTVYAFKGPRLLLKMIYDPERFTDADIQRRLGHLRNLLENMAADPETRIENLAMLSAAERWQLLGEWSRVEGTVLDSRSAGRPISREMARSAERIYVLDRWLEPVPLGMPGELYLSETEDLAGRREIDGRAGDRLVPDPLIRQPGARMLRTGIRSRFLPDGRLELLDRERRGAEQRGGRPPEEETTPAAPHVPPQTGLERMIAAIWRQVLAVDEIGMQDNFFDRGGHSLALVRAHERLAKELGRDLSEIDLFEYPTIGALAKRLAEGQPQQLKRDHLERRAAAQREVRRRRRARTGGGAR